MKHTITLFISSIFIATSSYAQFCFTKASINPFYVGGSSYDLTDVEFVDVNGDSYKDLVANSWSGNTVSVAFSVGSGNFATPIYYSVGLTPAVLESADFDNDGDMDIAVSYWGTGYIQLLINNGSGSFTLGSSVYSGAEPISILAGDYDNNGTQDIAVAHRVNNNISIILNPLGNGILSTAVTYPTNSLEPNAIVCADFNADGFKDLAVTNDNSNDISVFIHSGTGAVFNAPVLYITSSNPTASPYALATQDFDGNGSMDLAITNWQDANIVVMLNTGTGIFSPPVTYTLPNGSNSAPLYIRSVDFDNDSDFDLVVWDDQAGFHIFSNNGTGVFLYSYHYPYPGTGTGTYSLEAEDLDNDGNIDLAIGVSLSNDVFILLGHGALDTNVTSSGFNLTANATGPFISYQWMNCTSQTSIVGATNQTYTPSTSGNYAVIVSNGYCTDTSACVNVTTVGTSELTENKNSSIYPNPTNGVFSLKVNGKAENVDVSIYNAIGELVFVKNNITDYNFNLEHYANGVYYFFIIKDHVKGLPTKLIIQK